jgi:hypothetical protein
MSAEAGHERRTNSAEAGTERRPDSAQGGTERRPYRSIPAWLRPREQRPEETGSRRVWRIEAAVLVLVALLLAVATVNDVGRAAHNGERFNADIRTWRHFTNDNFHNLSVSTEVFGKTSKTEVVCGNTVGGAPGSKPQVCLVMVGAVRGGIRRVAGGWYTPAYVADIPSRRYGCFGTGARGRCPG